MKQSLRISRMVKNCAATLLFVFALSYSAFAQSPATVMLSDKNQNATTTTTSTNSFGKVSADGKSYTTNDGKILKVGDRITLGSATNKSDDLFIHCTKMYIRHITSSGTFLRGYYAGQTFEIKEIFINKLSSNVPYLSFSLGNTFIEKKLNVYCMPIEAAILDGELKIK